MVAIKEMRSKKNMSQIELANKLGVRANTLSQWEAGTRNPKIELLPRLAEILGCTVDELLTKEKAPSDTEQEGGA